MLWILICASIGLYHLSSQIFKWVKIWLFNKSDDVSFMYRWFIYVTMKASIVPRQCHFLVYVISAIRSVPITAVRWPSLGKLILGLSDIQILHSNTSRLLLQLKLGTTHSQWCHWAHWAYMHQLWKSVFSLYSNIAYCTYKSSNLADANKAGVLKHTLACKGTE